MADLIARRDPDTGYVFLSTGDEYPIPDDLFRALRADHQADYSTEHKGELRIAAGESAGALALVKERGHNVTSITGHRMGARRAGGSGARGPLECATCKAPYRVGTVVRPGQRCYAEDESGHPLVLLDPHTCGPECREAAWRRTGAPIARPGGP